MTEETTHKKDNNSGKSLPLKQKIAAYGGIAHTFVEFCGRHPFATGLFALLSVAGLLLSIVGYRLDRQDAESTTEQVRRVEEKIDKISVKNNAFAPSHKPVYRECDDHQVYLAVMESARNLPEPYSNWTVRGSSGTRTLTLGVCEMTVLFVTGDPSGKMQEIDVSYKTDVPVSSIRIQTAKTEEEECKNIILTDDLISTSISGEVEPEGYNCYYLSTQVNKTVKIDVESKMGWLAASVVGVGDARDEFEFLTTKNIYEVRVFHLMRSVENDKYALMVSIK